MFLRNEHFLLSMGIPSNDSVQDVSDFKQRYFLLDARIESDVLLCSQLDDIFSRVPSIDDILGDEREYAKVRTWGMTFERTAREFSDFCKTNLPQYSVEDVVKSLVVFEHLRYDGGLALAQGVRYVHRKDSRFQSRNIFMRALDTLASINMRFFTSFDAINAKCSVEEDPEWVRLWGYVQREGSDQGHAIRYHTEDEPDSYYVSIEPRESLLQTAKV